MNGVKGFFQSRVIWASIAALLGFILNKWGYEFTAADQAQLVDTVSMIAGIGGPVLAMIYRVKATKQVVATPVVAAK